MHRSGPGCSAIPATGWRSNGNRSARSGEYRSAITSAREAAYGRAATTRSCARFNFDVATSSIVFVILRVLWTDLIRRRSSRRSEEHTSELQSQSNLVCRLLLEKKKKSIE